MADTSLKLVHSSTAPISPVEPVALHARTHNALSRCMRELWADPVNYEAATRHLDEASAALRALAQCNAAQLS